MLSRTSPHVGPSIIHQLGWILFVIAAIAAFVYVGVDVVGELVGSFSESIAEGIGAGGR